MKKKNELSCFYNMFPYATHYMLRHPWLYLRHIGYALRDCYHRIRYGFCPSDVYDMDDYLAKLLPAMLHQLAEGYGYPGDDEFPTHEAWASYLKECASNIEAYDVYDTEADGTEKLKIGMEQLIRVYNALWD